MKEENYTLYRNDSFHAVDDNENLAYIDLEFASVFRWKQANAQ